MLATLSNESRNAPEPKAAFAQGLEPRRFPYPYRAMLAICSDLDEMPDRTAYAEQMRFLNTRATTSMGEGVGLEVGNTIYFDMPPDQFAYWNTDDAGREMVRTLIASGHVDALHSFGDLATTRAHAGRALDELAKHDLSVSVWIDHAVAPTNFGADIMQGHGDEPGHAAYHADLTLAQGVRYVWRGRVTSLIGQDGTGRSQCHPRASLRTVAKETAKRLLGATGSSKYAAHATNRLCEAAHLRDGQPVVEFIRANPHPHGVDFGDTGAGISEVLTAEFLDQLVEREGFCLLYTHLGKCAGGRFDQAAVEAFRLLTAYQQAGKILVTTTSRLLDYHTASEPFIRVGRVWDANVNAPGLTFYLPKANGTDAATDSLIARGWIKNSADASGRESISRKWEPLSFPDLH
jgi:hypothetical protein